MRSKLYIDFDATLFDSDEYDKELTLICNKYGISPLKSTKIRKQIFKKNTDFEVNQFIDYLINKENVDKSIYKEIEIFKKKSFLYSDTLGFLKEVSKHFDLCLLTCGNKNNQIEKIKASKINKLFKEIIITAGDKSSLANVDYKNGVFIDNNPKEIENLVKKTSKVYRVRRSTDKYSVYNLTSDKVLEKETLNDLLPVLEKI